MTIVQKWRLMLSSFADIKAAIIEKGGSVPDGKGYGYYANAVKWLYSNQNIAENKYPARLADIVAYMINLVQWCATVKEQIRIAIVDGGVECDENVPLSEYGNKIRQIAVLCITSDRTLPSGAVNVAYSAQLTATGGKPPYKWEVYSGLTPLGLTLSEDGVLSGTPSRTGTYQGIGIRVTDATGKSVFKSFKIYLSPWTLKMTVTAPKGCVYDGKTAWRADIKFYDYYNDPDCTTPLSGLVPSKEVYVLGGVEYPECLNAGTYSIKIWAPSGTLIKNDLGYVPLTVARMPVTITCVSTQKYTYDGNPHSFVYTASPEYTPTVKYKPYTAADNEYTETPPSEVGKYRVRIEIADTNHIFNNGSSNGTGTILKTLEITQ